jgi:hypothetical protein
MRVELKSRRRTSGAVIILLFFALVFMGGDIVPLSLRPLDYLGVTYPAVLGYTHLIAPAITFAMWAVFTRWQPNLSEIAAFVAMILCSVAIAAVPRWADQQIDKVKVTTWMDDISKLEGRLRFKIWEEGNSNGTELVIARIPGHAALLTAEVRQKGIFRQ